MSENPFGDIPLFQEIQRLLASGDGPINTEIALQVARSALGGEARPSPSPAREKLFADEVRAAEFLLAGYTRLQIDEPARAALITPERWIEDTLEGWKWLFEALAASFTRSFGEQQGQQMGAGSMMGPVVPLLMGLQVGTLLGELAKTSLGRFDLPIPRDDHGKIFLVERNADALVTDYDFDAEAFRKWIATRETSRGLVLSSAPWALNYLRAAFRDVVDSIEIDLSGIEQKLAGLQSGEFDPSSALTPSGGLPLVETERHRVALERVQSFISVFEGYSAAACRAVAGENDPDVARIEEGMARRSASPTDGEAALSSILGLSIDRQAAGRGKTFSDAVTSLHGVQALNLVWQAPDNLPTAEELRDPFAWIERVVEAPS